MMVAGEPAVSRTEGVSMRIAKASAIISGKRTVIGQDSGKHDLHRRGNLGNRRISQVDNRAARLIAFCSVFF